MSGLNARKSVTPSLSGAVPSFKVFMTKWESLGNNPEKPYMMDLVRPGLKWAYKYYARMDYTPTYIITMCKPIHPQSRFQISNDHIQSSTLPYTCHGSFVTGMKTISRLLRPRFKKS